MIAPYVADSEGKSVTRTFVESFLEAYTSPTEDRRSIFDTVTGSSAEPQEVLYLNKAANPIKRYIGRAAVALSGKNNHEFLWCVVADMASACRLLNPGQKRILDLKYLQDLGDHEIAHRLGVPAIKVAQAVDRAIDQIAAALDGEPC